MHITGDNVKVYVKMKIIFICYSPFVMPEQLIELGCNYHFNFITIGKIIYTVFPYCKFL